MPLRGRTMPRGRRPFDITDQKFGRLTVLKHAGRLADLVVWECICICGNRKTVRGIDLRSGHTKSCGCAVVERSSHLKLSHGHTVGRSRSPEYRSWLSMRRRCSDPTIPNFNRYGGAGISVCARWRDSFETFLADMGPKPSARHTIDRFPDGCGNYEPGNCRWATPGEQAANRRPPQGRAA